METMRHSRRCIVILGMHRSGTSAFTGVLHILGVSLGKSIMKAASDNPKGFFENDRITEVNEKILAHLSSSWHDTYPLDDGWWSRDTVSLFLNDINDIIRDEFNGEGVFCIKDPRICRLLPLWLLFFQELNVEPSFIIVTRNPGEVAKSLSERDEFVLEKSLALWMMHMLDAELYSRPYPRTFLTFDALLNDTEKAIKSITNLIAINNISSVKIEEIDNFLDRKLKHHTESEKSMNIVQKLIFDYYELMTELQYMSIQDNHMRRIDRIRKEYYDLVRFFYNRSDIQGMRERFLMQMNNVLLNSQLSHLIDEMKILKNTLSWRITRPLRIVKSGFKRSD